MRNHVTAYIGQMSVSPGPAPRAGGDDTAGGQAPAPAAPPPAAAPPASASPSGAAAATTFGTASPQEDPGGDLFSDDEGMTTAEAFHQGALRTDRDGNKLPPRFEEARAAAKQGQQGQQPAAAAPTPAPQPGDAAPAGEVPPAGETPDFSKMTPDQIVEWANQRAEEGGAWSPTIQRLKAEGLADQAAVDARLAEQNRQAAEAARAQTETDTVNTRLSDYWKQLVAGAQAGQYTMEAAKEAYLAEHALVSREVKAELMMAEVSRASLAQQADRALAEFSNIADGESPEQDVRNLVIGLADTFGVTPQVAAAHLDAIVKRAIGKRMAAAATKFTAAIQTAQGAGQPAAAPVMRGSTGGIATPAGPGGRVLTEDDDWTDLAAGGFLRRRD